MTADKVSQSDQIRVWRLVSTTLHLVTLSNNKGDDGMEKSIKFEPPSEDMMEENEKLVLKMDRSFS